MAGLRIKISRQALIKLMQEEQLIAGRIKAIEDACNSQSSWGGYASTVDRDPARVVGRVWSYARQDGSGTTERANRMIRNLEAE